MSQRARQHPEQMKSIEFELERTIQAPIDQVFARLVDIEGHNEWMPKKGSMLKRTRQTSPGEPRVGTTYVDETSQGALPGEIVDSRRRTRSSSTGGRSRGRQAQVRRLARLLPAGVGRQRDSRPPPRQAERYGVYGLAAPIFKRFAVRERTVTIDALKTSLEPTGLRSGMSIGGRMVRRSLAQRTRYSVIWSTVCGGVDGEAVEDAGPALDQPREAGEPQARDLRGAAVPGGPGRRRPAPAGPGR